MSARKSQPQSTAYSSGGLLLPGLDGTNPLGFLAALGLFRVLDTGNLRMSWTTLGGTWVPILHVVNGSTLREDSLLASLTERLATSIETHPAKLIESLGESSENEQGRRKLIHDVAAGHDRAQHAWMAALASDVAPSEAINQLQTTRRDYFYSNVKSVISRTNRDHLRRAIFHPWDYADALDNQSLHLDPGEDRRHAYQWNKPAGDPDRKSHGGMLGANRLALEAIPLFPSFPEAHTLRTVGFTGNRSTNTRWTWALWSAKLSLPVVQSFLAAAILQKDPLEATDIASFNAQGVVAVYRTRRILVGKTPNFTPAQCIA